MKFQAIWLYLIDTAPSILQQHYASNQLCEDTVDNNRYKNLSYTVLEHVNPPPYRYHQTWPPYLHYELPYFAYQ